MYEYTATYIRTVDGDTIDATVDLGFRVKMDIRIRLSLVDTPEKNEIGWKEATTFTRNWFEANPKFVLRTEKDAFGGFNRYLGECVSLDGSQSLNKLLLSNNLAHIYKRGE